MCSLNAGAIKLQRRCSTRDVNDARLSAVHSVCKQVFMCVLCTEEQGVQQSTACTREYMYIYIYSAQSKEQVQQNMQMHLCVCIERECIAARCAGKKPHI